MTDTQNTDAAGPDDHAPLDPGDPRLAFAMVTAAVRPLIAGADEHLSSPTPCSEFTVADLLDHLVLVMRRVAVIGAGGHWTSVTQEPVGPGWSEAFGQAAHDVQAAWTDPARLGQEFEVPWATLPGAAVLATYTAELATHGWDLATATGQVLVIDDELLGGAWYAASQLPAEGRGADVPFDEVVDPGPDAPLLERIAGWMGRPVV